MDVLEAIRTRRSVRVFLPDPVPEADIERILDAARYAPSAGNGQPWRFLVVTDRECLRQLHDRVIEAMERRIDASDSVLIGEKRKARAQYRTHAEKVFAAPVLVFVFVDTARHSDFACHDGALAVQNLLLAAHALGYGSCYQTSLFPEDLVKQYFGVPEGYQFICAVPIGKVASSPKDPGRRPLTDLVWRERCPEVRA